MRDDSNSLSSCAIAPVRNGFLHYVRCARTGQAQEYMHHRCLCCWSDDLESVRASGRGQLMTWVRYHRTYDPRFPHPHSVAVARLDEGVEVFAVLADAEVSQLQLGQQVQVEVDADGVLRARSAVR